MPNESPNGTSCEQGDHYERGNKQQATSILTIWKDLLSLVRDTTLLGICLLLIMFPNQFNELLVNAGFEEGSIVGFKWKSKLVESDQALKEAQANITDLSEQNERLSNALADIQAKGVDPVEKQRLLELEDENKKLKAASAKVEESVQATIATNSTFVEKAQIASSGSSGWIVIFGGDTTLAPAQFESSTIAKRLGITNTKIYFRQGSFRSVAIAANRADADQLLLKAKNRRKDAYIANIEKWCPNSTEKNGYLECVNQ